MHPMDHWFGRGLAGQRLPLSSNEYPPGVKSPAMRWEEEVRAEAEAEGWRRGFEHARSVVESAEFDSSHPNGGRALDAFKRALLMALRVAEKVARPPAESVVGALSPTSSPADDCGNCRRPFDPADRAFDGCARYRDTPFCRRCVDRCHESTDFAHKCEVCQLRGVREGKATAEGGGAADKPNAPDLDSFGALPDRQEGMTDVEDH